MQAFHQESSFNPGVTPALARPMDQEVTTIVDLTHRCNSPCRYCRWGNPRTEGRRHLPLDEVLLPPATLREVGTARVVFSGGEPLLYPHLNQVLHYYAEHVEHRVIITNGLLLSDEKRRSLRFAGATGFAFSIDAISPEAYFATRGWRPHQLARVLDNLRRAAADAEGLELGINAVVSRPTANWESVADLLAFGSALELNRVKFQPVFDDGYLSRSAPWLALTHQDVPSLQRIAESIGQLEGVPTNPPGFWRDLARIAAGSRLDGRQCGLGGHTVLVTGQRLARCYWVPEADLGSVSDLMPGALRAQKSIGELTQAKQFCQVDGRCFCLQKLPHEWGEPA